MFKKILGILLNLYSMPSAMIVSMSLKTIHFIIPLSVIVRTFGWFTQKLGSSGLAHKVKYSAVIREKIMLQLNTKIN